MRNSAMHDDISYPFVRFFIAEAPYLPVPLSGDMGRSEIRPVLRMSGCMESNPTEKARKIAEEALNRLSAELEAGRSEALKNYLAVMGRFHKYSWGNTLLIASQRPDATRVAGFHAWHQLGRSVKKGEKGIMILAPMMVKQKEQQSEQERPEGVFRIAGFRTAYVFDLKQTEGQPLPEFAKTAGDPKEFGDKLKAVAAARGISVEYDSAIAPAQGVSSGGRIRLMPDMAPAEEFSVLAHELAHEMLHHGPEGTRPPERVRETQAEAVAFVVCRGVGLETNNAAADYIALYNGDRKTLAESLSAIQGTSAKILDELLKQERPLGSPDKGEAAAPRTEHAPAEPPHASPPTPAPHPEEISMDR
jgi:antirestriction protein ArdC